MKATGIVRRIDDLGRVVIPKEIRRSMRIKEGDPLEIFTSDEGITFRKYSPIDSEKWDLTKNCLQALLSHGFSIADYHKDWITGTNGKETFSERQFIPLNEDLGYLVVAPDLYTKEELAVAAKIANEILNS